MNHTIKSKAGYGRAFTQARLLLSLALFTLLQVAVRGADVHFIWQPNTEADLAGYRLYSRDLREPHPVVREVGNVTTCTVQKLVAGRSYDFHLTAYNHAGLESDPSRVVRISVPANGLSHTDPGVDGLIVMLAGDHATTVNGDHHTWTTVTSKGTPAMRALPATGARIDSDYVSTSPYLQFNVNFPTTGTYYVWLRGLCTGNDNSAHVGLNGHAVASAENLRFPVTGDWVWSGTLSSERRATVNITRTGVQTIEVYMREDGFTLERLAFSKSSSYVPSGAVGNDRDGSTIDLERLPPTIVRLASNGPEFIWLATPGLAYQIQYKDDMNEPQWKELVTVLAGNTQQVYRDYSRAPDNSPLFRTHPRRFYRIVEMP
jgi:hypothetical protein